MSRRSLVPRHALQARGAARMTMGPARQWSEQPLRFSAEPTARTEGEPAYEPSLPAQWSGVEADAEGGSMTTEPIPAGSIMVAFGLSIAGARGWTFGPEFTQRPPDFASTLASTSRLTAAIGIGLSTGGPATANVSLQSSPYPDFARLVVYYVEGQEHRLSDVRATWDWTDGAGSTVDTHLLAPRGWEMTLQGTFTNGFVALVPELPFATWFKSRDPLVMGGVTTRNVPGGVGPILIRADTTAPENKQPSAWFNYMIGLEPLP